MSNKSARCCIRYYCEYIILLFFCMVSGQQFYEAVYLGHNTTLL